MNKKQQVEKMVEILKTGCDMKECSVPICCDTCEAEMLYDAGVRIEPEWKSVTDELPPEGIRVLVYLREYRDCPVRIDTDRIKDGRFVRWHALVAYWRELPEVPGFLENDGKS